MKSVGRRMEKNMLRSILLGSIVGLVLGLFVHAIKPAKVFNNGLGADYAAITHCDENGTVKSVVDIKYVENDTGVPSLREILVHEAVHRKQMIKDGCDKNDVRQVYLYELEANCKSYKAALESGRETPEEVGKRVAGQFYRFFNVINYVDSVKQWKRVCPEYPLYWGD